MQDTVETAQACELPLGSYLLKSQYEIQAHLATGGFGITYLARDSLARQVVVKECFPHQLCVRDGYFVKSQFDSNQKAFQKIVGNFIGEARRLATLKHPNIVGVHQVFKENQTAYMAMDFVDGRELLDILEVTPERLTPKLMWKMLRDALDALHYLHSVDILHRDISPDNLLLDGDDHLVLIDFGAAVEYPRQLPQNSSSVVAVKDGYSPHEFYVNNKRPNASSDLYSLAATFYHLITGEAPADCWTRYTALDSGLPDPYTPLAGKGWRFGPNFLALIDRALSVYEENRIQSAEEWLKFLGEEPEKVAAPVVEAISDEKVPSAPSPSISAEDLGQVISRLVKDTNSGLEENPEPAPIKSRQPAQPPAISAQTTKSKKFVDIMGNPIEDVETWMREQDKKSQQEKRKKPCREEEPVEKPEAAPKPLILRLLSGHLNLWRSEAPAARS